MNNKNEKVGLSTFEWIMSILGLLFFSSFIILPPLFRLVIPKQEEVEPEKPVIIVKTLKCTIKNKLVETHSEDDEIIFKSVQNQLRSYSRERDIVYTTTEEFDTNKTLFGKYSTAYSLLEGVSYDILPVNGTLSINVKESYDFESFSPRTISIPGEEEAITLSSDFKSGESIVSIKDRLVEEGYTCDDGSSEEE